MIRRVSRAIVVDLMRHTRKKFTRVYKSLQKFTIFNKVYMMCSFDFACGGRFVTVGLSGAAEALELTHP